MPRLSMWRDNHTNDYKFFDKRISEEFTIGGTGVLLHKYIGTNVQANAYPTANTTVSGRTLYFGNVAPFEVGQAVSGIGIAANTIITGTNVTINTVTISANVTSASNISIGNNGVGIAGIPNGVSNTPG